MTHLNWKEIENLANQSATLLTKTKVPFQVVASTENTLTVRVRSGEQHTISRINLEKAIELINSGEKLNGPGDYLALVADDRPAYAWAILKFLKYIK